MRIEEIDEELEKLGIIAKTVDEKDRLFEMKRKVHGPDEIVSSVDYMKTNKQEEVLFKAFTGLPTIDGWIKGFRPGSVNIISGLTKQGKTTFCQTMTVNFTNQGLKCLWFSLDTPPIELIERFPSMPLFYLPKDNFLEQKIEWIEDKVIEGLAKFDTRIVFIDNLEFLTLYEKGGDNYANQLGNAVIRLKQIAMKWNVVIFLNHHVRSIPEGKVPSWQDLKDSSSIAHHADTVFTVWRNMIKTPQGNVYDPTIGFISLQAQRRGGKTGIQKVEHKDNLFYEYHPPKDIEL